ncbi:hypothetical protein ANN_08423 [Periplaneta americana]|uniref:Uncharacterized protein n=1 Tax=Periplaneta americana TaxID=6978 RepID=A0ABQ8T2J4_PERAM|nr:hypothetical protein ANN_08423 [Periplaneta americana]
MGRNPERRGMTINHKKSQVLMVVRTEELVEQIKIEYDGQQLTQVESYEYLGTTIHQTGKLQGEVHKQAQKATNSYFLLCPEPLLIQ